MSDLAGKSILLVGLDGELQESVTVALLDSEVVICHSATEAFHAVQQLSPDLALIDVDLPGFDWHHLCRCIRQSWRNGPKLLILVGDSTPEARLAAYEAGADDCVVKPFTSQEIFAKSRILTHLKSEEQLGAMKVELLDMIAHELRTPLTGIIVAAETLATTFKDEETRPWVDMVRDCGHRLQLLVDKGLLLCQMRSGDYSTDPANHDLSQIVRRLARDKTAAAEAEDVRIVVHDEGVASIYADKSSVETLIRFLLDNALRHCSPHSVVSASIQTNEHEVELTLTAAAQTILPINPFSEFVPRVVDGQFVGADFGLAIAKELMRELDGSLELSSARTGEISITCAFPKATERRHGEARLPTLAPATLVFPNPAMGLGVETSDTGCFVTVDSPLSVQLQLGDVDLPIRGRVVRVQMAGGLIGLGIQFDERRPDFALEMCSEALASDKPDEPVRPHS